MRLRAGLRVLRRTATEVQVGTDPRWAVRLPDLTRAETDLLLAVDARTDLAGLDVVAAGVGVDADRVRDIVGTLAAAGLTEDLPRRPLLRGPAAVDADVWSLLRADGDGPGLVRGRADRVVGVLGLGPDRARDRGRARGGAASAPCSSTTGDRCARPTSASCGYRWSDVGSVREQVAARLLRDVAPHVSTVSDRRPDVVVLVEDRVADPLRGPVLVAGSTAHLSVVVREADIVVGPLVVPGTGPCLRCLDLHRADADPAWPVARRNSCVPTGSSRARPAPSPRSCAGIGAAAVLAHLDREPGLAPGATLEVGLPDAIPRRRTWAVHPECGCTALPASLVGAPGRTAR